MLRASCRMILVVSTFAIAADATAKSFSWKVYSGKTDDWYRSAEGTRTAENILSNQSDLGDWPKNIDTSEKPFTGDRARLRGTSRLCASCSRQAAISIRMASSFGLRTRAFRRSHARSG